MNDSDPRPAGTANAQRRKGLLALGGAVLLGAIGWAAYWALVLNHYESTDNAYVQGNVVQITPQVGGTVVAVAADETDFVKAGQPLVKLDPTDARVALEQAEAQLAQAVREVRTLYAQNGALAAQVTAREADAGRAQSELARAQDDVSRRAPLVASGAVGKEEFDHASAQLGAARGTLAGAQAALLAAREQLAANRALTDGTDVERHPSVQRAAARVHEAYLALSRTELPAPVDGHVAKRAVQVGQRVAAGAALMTVVSLGDVWVDANFKESQLGKLRIGQPATLTADVYGGKVDYHGTVSGLGAGTGAAFALLPAQNATGNWIKIVQRVPVRIALDAKDVVVHPLRLGLSMEARVDVSRRDGKALADVPRAQPASQTQVFDRGNGEAEAQVRRIIAAHAGSAAAIVRAPAASAERMH